MSDEASKSFGVARGAGHDRDAADARDQPRGARDVHEHGGGGADGGFRFGFLVGLFFLRVLLRCERRR